MEIKATRLQGWITAMKDLPRYYRAVLPLPHALVLPQYRVSYQKYRTVVITLNFKTTMPKQQMALFFESYFLEHFKSSMADHSFSVQKIRFLNHVFKLSIPQL